MDFADGLGVGCKTMMGSRRSLRHYTLVDRNTIRLLTREDNVLKSYFEHVHFVKLSWMSRRLVSTKVQSLKGKSSLTVEILWSQSL